MINFPSNDSGAGSWWLPPRNANLAFLAGLLVTLGLPPVPWTGLLVPVGLAILFAALRHEERPGRLVWIFALAHQASLLHWLFLLIPAKTIPTRALVPLQATAAIVYVTLFYGLLGWLFGLLRRRIGYGRALLLMPVLWSAMEFLRSHGEMAFPWCLTGSAVVGTPLMSLLPASGEPGMGALVVFCAVFLALAWLWWRGQVELRSPCLLALTGSLVLFSLLLVGSQWKPALPRAEGVPGDSRADPAPVRDKPLMIAAIQADVSLQDKWQEDKIDSTRIPYQGLTAEAVAQGAEFVVWAETAVPAYLRFASGHLRWLREGLHQWQVPLYTGFPDAERLPDGTVNKYNSSGLFAANGTLLARYAKHHLLPIGEAMPFTSLIPALKNIDVGQAEWTPGRPPEALHLATDQGDFPFSGLICFESILGDEARHSILNGSRCLMVLTNDGWFGETAGPRQHTLLAVMRAAECRVPLVRCANNGISLICDQRGSIQARLALGKRGFVMAEVAPGSGRTVYVRWGLRPLWIYLLLWAALVLGYRRSGG